MFHFHFFLRFFCGLFLNQLEIDVCLTSKMCTEYKSLLKCIHIFAKCVSERVRETPSYS